MHTGMTSASHWNLIVANIEYKIHTHSVRNKVAKVVGQMSEHFEFGLDIFNLGRTMVGHCLYGSSCHIMQRKIHCKTIT